MASSPCDCWSHLSPSSSVEHLWNDIKLLPLSNSSHSSSSSSSSSSSFLNQPPSSIFPTLTSTSTSQSQSQSLFHTSSHASHSITNKTKQDQRRMRIIKNRESAVRSRARKQAYRKGLEVEIARLTEENSRLRSQLKELQCCLGSSDNPPRVRALCRTSSCPF